MDKTKEEIKYETELLRLVWATAVAAIGGSIGLLLGDPSALRSALAGVGLLVTLAFIVSALHQHRKVRSLLNKMEDTQ